MTFVFSFPANATVVVPGGAKQMGSLRVGDDVRVFTKHGQAVWSKIVGWLRREPERSASYLQITTSARTLSVSEEHLIGVVRNGRVAFVRACEVQPGTTLLECEVSSVACAKSVYPPVWGNTVQRIERVTLPGVFAPLTMEGTIIVDGVGASCYAATHSHKAAHTAIKPMWPMLRHNPEKVQRPTHVGKRVPGSHTCVDTLARVAVKA